MATTGPVYLASASFGRVDVIDEERMARVRQEPRGEIRSHPSSPSRVATRFFDPGDTPA